MTDNELPIGAVGVNLPAVAYTLRAIGRAQVPDYRFLTNIATVRVMLIGLRRWLPERE
jgi:hypothetical protein